MAKANPTGTPLVHRESEVTGIVVGIADYRAFEDKPAVFTKTKDTKALTDLAITKLSLKWNQINSMLHRHDLLLMVNLQGTTQYIEAEVDKSKIPALKKVMVWMKRMSKAPWRLLTPVTWVWDPFGGAEEAKQYSYALRGARVAMTAAEGNKYVVTRFLDGDIKDPVPTAAKEKKKK